MPEPVVEPIAADASESFSFFQLESEILAANSDIFEITLDEITSPSSVPTPQPRLDSDNDCACE